MCILYLSLPLQVHKIGIFYIIFHSHCLWFCRFLDFWWQVTDVTKLNLPITMKLSQNWWMQKFNCYFNCCFFVINCWDRQELVQLSQETLGAALTSSKIQLQFTSLSWPNWQLDDGWQRIVNKKTRQGDKKQLILLAQEWFLLTFALVSDMIIENTNSVFSNQSECCRLCDLKAMCLRVIKTSDKETVRSNNCDSICFPISIVFLPWSILKAFACSIHLTMDTRQEKKLKQVQSLA